MMRQACFSRKSTILVVEKTRRTINGRTKRKKAPTRIKVRTLPLFTLQKDKSSKGKMLVEAIWDSRQNMKV